MWIYEQPEWPNFTWDEQAVSSLLPALRHKQGYTIGRMKSLGINLRDEAGVDTVAEDVVRSWAIEGEKIDGRQVRSSVAEQLGIEIGGLKPVPRHIDGIVEMMLDATRNYSAALTAERLYGWQAALFPAGRSAIREITVGAWRTGKRGDMQIVSGRIGRERVHFIAPKAQNVPAEMKAFLKWFNTETSVDPVVKAGIAHLYFVTIHPFEDGNGRIARALTDMLLARADGTAERFYSVSRQLEQVRKDYYSQLESAQSGTTDITEWLTWFLAIVDRALDDAEDTLAQVMQKARFWEQAGQYRLNDRQRLILNRLLDNFKGYLNTSKYAKIAKCSTDTALRDIKALVGYGLLAQNPGGGRSTSYRLHLPEYELH